MRYAGSRLLGCIVASMLLASSSILPSAAQRAQLTGGAGEPIDIDSRPLTSFERVGGGKKQYGRLEFRGGLVLTSPSSDFGGLSGIELSADGRQFVMVSDEAGWLTGEIVYAEGRPAKLAGVRRAQFQALNGRPLDRKRDADAESIALLSGTPANGVLLVAFERNQRLGRFPVKDGVVGAPQSYLKLPPDARRMKSNKGFEAVAVMQGGPHKGAPIAFAEKYLDANGHHTGWLWIGGEPQRLAVRDIGDFELTDVKSLADGSLLLLERRFRWLEGVKMRLRLIKAAAVQPGAVLDGEVLLEADMTYEIDNMEGLAVHKGPLGETVLTLVSDDNYNSILQRTLLLQFTLRPEGVAAAAPQR